MPIIWRPVSGNFSDTLFNTILQLEAPDVKDRWQLEQGVETPTIGVGFDLLMGANEAKEVLRAFGFRVKDAWVDVSVTAGQPQAKEQQYIKKILALISSKSKVQADYDAVMASRKSDIEADAAYGQFIPVNRRGAFKFNNDIEVRAVFDALWPGYRTSIFSKLNASITNDSVFQSSKELIALACSRYLGTFGPSIAAALNSGDRASAWFAFRYGWKDNKPKYNDGWAKRHYFESALLGLYDDPANAVARLDEAISVYEMFTKNMRLILQREATYGAPPDGSVNANNRIPSAKSDYQAVLTAAGSNDPRKIYDELVPARDALISWLNTQLPSGENPLVSTQWNPAAILLNTAKQSLPILDARPLDGMVGSMEKNLLIGGDVSDHLVSGKGNDVLVGGKGNDVLEGGAGDDALYGGEGEDTYLIDLRDGAQHDRVIDSDGRGHFLVVDASGGIVNTSVLQRQGTADVWVSKDAAGNVTATLSHNGPWQLALAGGSVIDLGGSFNPAGFGITLQEASDPPASVMLGDFVKKIDPKDPSQYLFGSDDNYIANGAKPNAADLITGTEGSDFIQGLGGDDALLGDAGDDIIEGGEGNDVLMGGLGKDTIKGGAGIDIIYGSSTGDLVYPAETNYVRPPPKYADVLGQGFSWTFSALPGVDSDGLKVLWLDSTIGREVPTSDLGNVIDGGSGNDAIYAGVGADIVHGGDDSDDISGMAGNDVLYGDDGGDRIFGDGTIRNDAVTYTPAELHGKDVIDGGAGNDTLLGQGNDDVILGGDGNDKIYGDDRRNADTPPEAAGNDRLQGGADDDTIIGGGRNDEILGGTGNDKLYGDAGPRDPANPLAAKFHGDDYIDGGDGNDYLKGEGGNDILYGGSENDSIYGDDDIANLPLAAHGNDYLDGGIGNDYLNGQGGDDWLVGGEGDDTLVGGGGADTLDGGEGVNNLDGADGDDVIMASLGDIVIGGAGNDTFILNAAAGALDYSAGWSQADQDQLVLGGLEIAALQRQSKDMVLQFTDGSSTVVSNYFGMYVTDPRASQVGLKISLSDGTTWDEANISAQIVETSLNLVGTTGNDELVGTQLADSIAGDAGDDRINGREGDDALHGGDGSDFILGSGGNDSLSGDAGDDTLDGGIGSDALSGGAGIDTYRFDRGTGQDTIVGGSSAEAASDVVQLGKGISTKDVSVTVRPEGLLLTITGSPDSLLIALNTTGGTSSYAASQLRFESGAVRNLNEYASSSLNDSLVGTSANNFMDGGEGWDSLLGLGGADTLVGGLGSDLLDGGADNDDVMGGGGADTLLGGDGDDRLGGEDQLSSTGASTLLGDDSLNGGLGNDSLYGGNGDDTLDGGSGTDRLYGGSGSDLLRGGTGVDELNGGAGNDTYEITRDDMGVGPSGETDTIVDQQGSNALRLDVATDAVSFTHIANSSDVVLSVDAQHAVRIVGATEGAIAMVQFAGTAPAESMDRLLGERLYSQVTENTDVAGALLFGGALNDALSAGQAAEGVTVSGGRGNDHITLGSLGGATVLFSKGDGTDTLSTNFDLSTDRTADNVLKLGGGISLADLQLLDLGSGQFSLQIGAAGDGLQFAMDPKLMKGVTRPFDRIEFADGSKATWGQLVDHGISPGLIGVSLLGTGANDTLTGGGGVDLLQAGAGDDLLTGGAAHDDLQGDAGQDALYGEAGNDSLTGGAGRDTLFGGEGNDRLVGDYLSTAIEDTDPYGVWSEDILDGGSGDDTLYGGAGYDRLYGGTGNDLLVGGAGDDKLYGGDFGNDTLLGGRGNDGLEFGDHAGGIADGQAGDDYIGGLSVGKTVLFSRGGGNDTITGSDINGAGGALQFEDGITISDLIFSRPADEPFSYVGQRLDIRIAGTLDVVSIERFFDVDGQSDNLSPLQEIRFSNGDILTEDDILRRMLTTRTGTYQGSANQDVIVGGQGNDTMSGNGGDDILWGAEGDDQLNGGAGYDDLRGGNGADVLDGGADNDRLAGGNGNDVLLGGSGYDTLSGGSGNDTLDGGA